MARPSFIAPMLATLVDAPVDLPGWVYEEKYDGIRVVAHRRKGKVALVTRNLNDVTDRFAPIAAAVAALPGGDMVLDGEIVAFDRRDVSRFQLLQRRALGAPIPLVYAVFDCLERDGESLLGEPLRERRRALEALVPDRGDPLMRARRVHESGVEAYRLAAKKGWEGIVAKDEASPYESGKRSRSWLKIKVRKEAEFVIGGFTPPAGSRSDFGAILVGLFDGDHLRYTGKIGTGFTRAVLADLGAKMRHHAAKASPFDPPPRVARVTWIRPKLVAQVGFTEWTRDGKLRHPVFLGLRTDKAAREVTWDRREK